jgi:RecA-family ATPase
MTTIKRAKLNASAHGKDPNDLRDRPEVVLEVLRGAERLETAPEPEIPFAALAPRPPGRDALVISESEWENAALTPKCIVENHLYADVAQRVAPGGTGKTTLTLWEAVHIVLGKHLYGERVVCKGWVLYITAEDPRERLIARLRAICYAMGLNEREIAQVRQALLFWDLTAMPAKMAMEADGNILLTPLAERIVEAFRNDPPVLVEIDPTVSFGASEARVNDNEQALVLAARVMVKGLDACVRYTHHTGKSNAREKTTDQYSGRGGSAMADGCRMVHVLQSWSPKEKGSQRPPITLDIGPQTGVITYTRAKMSHCPPNLPVLWIARNGFNYDWAEEYHLTAEQEATANAEQILQFLRSEVRNERYHTRNTLEAETQTLGMTRTEIRNGLSYLEVRGMVVEKDLPKDRKKGGRKSYWAPADVVQPGAKPFLAMTRLSDVDAESEAEHADQEIQARDGRTFSLAVHSGEVGQ